MYTTRFDTWLA